MNRTDDARTRSWIAALVAAVAAKGEKPSVLLAAAGGGLTASLVPRASANVVALNGTDAAGELGDSGLFDLAIVDGDSLQDAAVATRLIASLRDRYARRVVVIDDSELLGLSDYLALGFERLDTEAQNRSFIHDPDSASRQREWNNARHWANPQNFGKYRW